LSLAVAAEQAVERPTLKTKAEAAMNKYLINIPVLQTYDLTIPAHMSS